MIITDLHGYLVPQPQQCFSQQQSLQRRGMLVLLSEHDIMSVMSPRQLHRTPVQVYLEPRQLEMLRDLADRRGEPMTHLVRESLERYLVDEIGQDDPLLGLVGMIRSGHTDTAGDHDRVLTEHQLTKRERSTKPRPG